LLWFLVSWTDFILQQWPRITVAICHSVRNMFIIASCFNVLLVLFSLARSIVDACCTLWRYSSCFFRWLGNPHHL
jgi:hypothetical protein